MWGHEGDQLERVEAVVVHREKALEVDGAYARGHVVAEVGERVREEVNKGGDGDIVEVELGGGRRARRSAAARRR